MCVFACRGALLAELGVLAAWNDNPSVWIDTVSVPGQTPEPSSLVTFGGGLLALGGLLRRKLGAL
jgi:hypothetical protein